VVMAAIEDSMVGNTPPHAVSNQTPICQLTFKSPQPVVNEAHASEFSQRSNIDNSSDGDGIMCAPMCKADVDSKCFTSTNKKICEQKVNAVELDTVGDFVVFPSRFYHRGCYRIASNMIFYMAQPFCKNQIIWRHGRM
jgi:hypothetical protein